MDSESAPDNHEAGPVQSPGTTVPRHAFEALSSPSPNGGGRRGLFVISLDFEQVWGVRHLWRLSDQVSRLVGARTIVLSLLDIFRDYGIHATWAVVGFLFFDSGAGLRAHLPALRPRYANPRLCPYQDLPPSGARESPESIFFARSLISRIAGTPHQEIGTHTLSHYYCLEPGQDMESFSADLSCAVAVAREFGVEVRSLVFPKNQCRPDYLKVCADHGIVAYRGNPGSWLYRPNPDRKQQMLARRLGRLLDAYVPVASTLSESLPLSAASLPLNVPASRFLRPYMPSLRLLEPLRLARIMGEMTFAARAGRLYHLWWHPHDFGVDPQANLRLLRLVLGHYKRLNAQYRFQSMNMVEAAADALLPQRAGKVEFQASNGLTAAIPRSAVHSLPPLSKS